MTTPAAAQAAGMAAAENAADPRVLLAVDKVIADLNASGMPWSANDARAALPVTSSGLVGARIKAASMRRPREMEAVGLTRSDLPSTHLARITVWRGVAT